MNFEQILTELHSAGLSDPFMAKQIGASASVIQQLRVGARTETSYSKGVKINDLYKKFKSGKIKVLESKVVIEG